MTIDRFSLYSVISSSSAEASAVSADSPQENSKIALPTTESATEAYFAAKCFMRFGTSSDYRARTVVALPEARPQVTV